MTSKETVFDKFVSVGAYKWYLKLAEAEAKELARQDSWNDGLSYAFGLKLEEWGLVYDRARLEQLSSDVLTVVDCIASGKPIKKVGLEVLALLKAYEAAIQVLKVDNDLMDVLQKIKLFDTIRLAALDRLDVYLADAQGRLYVLEGLLRKARFDTAWSAATTFLDGALAIVTILGPELPLAIGLGAAIGQWALGAYTGADTGAVVKYGGHASSGAGVVSTTLEHVSKVNKSAAAKNAVKTSTRTFAVVGVAFDFAEVLEGSASVQELQRAANAAQAELMKVQAWYKTNSEIVNRLFQQVKDFEVKAQGKRAKALENWNYLSGVVRWSEDSVTSWVK
jgi:hypothetical protein